MSGGGSAGERFAENWIRQNNATYMAENAHAAEEEQEKGSAGGDRAGKPFTPRGKREIYDRNAQRNGGENRCEKCDEKVVPAEKSKKGVRPTSNERQADHIIPRSKGGDGAPSNGQALCRNCNRDKSDKEPQ
jgi:5-methylcytosine-specific restriction endonuclease McrA